jgi:hypothetical protein
LDCWVAKKKNATLCATATITVNPCKERSYDNTRLLPNTKYATITETSWAMDNETCMGTWGTWDSHRFLSSVIREPSPEAAGRDNTGTRRCGGPRGRAFATGGPAWAERTGEEAVQGRGPRVARASREPSLSDGRCGRRVLGRKNTVPGKPWKSRAPADEPGTRKAQPINQVRYGGGSREGQVPKESAYGPLFL